MNVKKGVYLAATLFALAGFLFSCGGEGGADTTATEASPDKIPLVNAGATAYTVIRGETAEQKDIDAAVDLRKAIIERTGVDIKITTDWVNRGEEIPTDTWEIVVGKSNRPETEAAKALIGEDQYIIKMYPGRLVIYGAKPKYTMEAVAYFLDTFLPEHAEELSIPADYEYIADGKLPPATTVEIDSVVSAQVEAFVKRMESFDVGENNYGNNYIYGKGLVLEGMGLVYSLTKETELLPIMTKASDKILMARNDQKNGAKKVCISGQIDYCWPNNEKDLFAGSENGGIVGHVAYVAECILETPEIWDEIVPDKDPNGLGKTYYERALTYARMCDEVLVDYIIKYFLSENDLIVFPTAWSSTGDGRVGRNPPWNQQFMMSGGFIHMARVHELLGEKGNAEYAAKYRTIVQKLLDHFLSQLILYTTEDGHEVYNWSYWPLQAAVNKRYVENASDAHAAYDVQGVYYGYLYGYDNIDLEILQRFANTMKYVIYHPDEPSGKWFSFSVDGTNGSKEPRNYTWPQWYLIAAVDPELFDIFRKTTGDATSASGNDSRWPHAIYAQAILAGTTES